MAGGSRLYQPPTPIGQESREHGGTSRVECSKKHTHIYRLQEGEARSEHDSIEDEIVESREDAN